MWAFQLKIMYKLKGEGMIYNQFAKINNKMESPIKWIFSKFGPLKMIFPRKSASKEKGPKSPQKPPTAERKIKKVRILEARSRAPLF
jgi:hypothetical protein